MRRTLLSVWLLMTAFMAPIFAQTYTVFPQFASGSGWTCQLFLANQGLSAVSNIIISFYGDGGAPLPVDCNLGTGAVFSLNLNAGATQVVYFTPSQLPLIGYVVIKYPTQATIRASEVYRFEQGGIVLAEVGVPQQYPDTNFSFPIEIKASRGILSAVAFANPILDSAGAQSQELVVNLIRQDGTLHRTGIVSLKAGEHIALYLNEAKLFGGLDNFTGSVSVSSASPIGVLALRQDAQAFGGISTDNGPLLGPFQVTGFSVPEAEPNNSPAVAQMLSGNALVTGTIGAPSDVDYLKIVSRKGDIVSAICETEGLDSLLDSVLILAKSDGTTIVTNNDQNGLYQRNDSFFQTVIPEDGSYYIIVMDYWGDGGSNYGYRLHVKIIGAR